jgi:hypothetical protein
MFAFYASQINTPLAYRFQNHCTGDFGRGRHRGADACDVSKTIFPVEKAEKFLYNNGMDNIEIQSLKHKIVEPASRLEELLAQHQRRARLHRM